MKVRQAGFILFAITCGLAATAGADVSETIEAHITAIGGHDAINSIKTFQRSGDLEMGGMFGNMSGTFEEKAIVGKKVYNKMDLGQAVEESGWNGETGWNKESSEPTTEVDDDDLEDLKSNAYIDPIVAVYKEYGAAAFRETGESTFAGIACRGLEIVDEGLTFFLDVKNHMLLGIRMLVEDPGMGQGEVAITFADHQVHNGVRWPGTMKIDIADGTITLDYAYTKTVLNADIDDRVFERP